MVMKLRLGYSGDVPLMRMNLILTDSPSFLTLLTVMIPRLCVNDILFFSRPVWFKYKRGRRVQVVVVVAVMLLIFCFSLKCSEFL